MRIGVGFAVAATLSGCATVPVGTDVALRATDSAVVAAIRCAYAEAFSGSTLDPAGLGNWGALATLTDTQSDGAATRPALAVADGSAGAMKWKAVGGGTKFERTTEEKSVLEYTVLKLSNVDPAGTCPAPGSAASAKGLDLAHFLEDKAASLPDPSSGAKVKSLSYIRVYTVTATAGGGLSFAVGDVSLNLEGNSLSRTSKYEINIQFTKPTAGADLSTLLGVLRSQRDDDLEKETTITVAPGQSIIIQ